DHPARTEARQEATEMNGDPRMIVAQRRMADRRGEADEARLARISRRHRTVTPSRPGLVAWLAAAFDGLAVHRRAALSAPPSVRVRLSRQ
ncbi:MAG: hypothetical protein ACXWNG_02665, partial [Candidatus Limnocylindrales bacterium]